MGVEEGDNGDETLTLIAKLPNESDASDEHITRTGTVWGAVAHIITAVIGSGVLSLSWSVAQLGWIGGPVTMICFAAITLLQSTLLADCYRSPDPDSGHIRNRSYMGAVRLTLGERSMWISAIFQQVGLYSAGVAYIITASYSISSIERSICYQREGLTDPCSKGERFPMLMFGLVQIIFSQIPDFHNMQWLSVVAAVMSFSYSIIGVALVLAKAIGNGVIKGGITGVSAPSTSQKMWRISQAIGDIAFAYPYSVILLEVQNTLKSPPPENQTMKKASTISITIVTVFYLCCGCFGYAAFGEDTPGNLLTGFGASHPKRLVDFANACIVLHLVGGYQMFSQPIFGAADRWFARRFLSSSIHGVHLPFQQAAWRSKLFRICFRTLYVVSTTGVAMAFPYFNQVIALSGAFSFWPLAIYFPVEMYLVQRKIVPWTSKWMLLQLFSSVCLLLSIIALVGSIEGLLSHRSFK